MPKVLYAKQLVWFKILLHVVNFVTTVSDNGQVRCQCNNVNETMHCVNMFFFVSFKLAGGCLRHGLH